MKLVLGESKYLTDSISIMSELVNEITLNITKDCIEAIAMDPANVAMVVFKLLASCFTEYELKESQELTINLDHFKQILKRAKASDVVTLTLDQEKNKLRIKIFGDSTRSFNLALINHKEKKQKLPDLEFPLKIETYAAIFDEAIEDMGIVSESVSLEATKDSFIVRSESKMNAAKAEIKSDDSTAIILKGDPIKAKYSFEYLKKMIKASKLSKNIAIQFAADYPLRLDYNVKDKVALSFILAPRVSND